MSDLSQESPLWREWAESRHSVQQMREELDRLRAELEIARKDAERRRAENDHLRFQARIRYGYAPGDYMQRCGVCEKEHIADKRAAVCKECADAAIDNARGGE